MMVSNKVICEKVGNSDLTDGIKYNARITNTTIANVPKECEICVITLLKEYGNDKGLEDHERENIRECVIKRIASQIESE